MKKRLLCVVGAAFLLCGCGYNPSLSTHVFGSENLISSPSAKSSVNSLATSEESESSSSSSSSSSSFGSSSSQSTADMEFSSSTHDYNQIPYIELSITDEQRQFTEQSLFIGDSICKGLEVFGVLKADNVLGVGNAAARNIFEMEFFRRGKGIDFLSVIKDTKPKHAIFWMGMNDVNMTDKQEYCENYRKVIDKALELPETDVLVLSISPVCSDFTPNSRIVEFNRALSDYITKTYPERVRFVNIHDALQNEKGELQWYFSSGDGVHINELAYYQMLHAFFEQVDISQENEPVQSSQTSSSGESSSTSKTSQTSAAESISAAT